MTSSTTDRRLGINGGLAIKAPCIAATTANITLSGEQTIDSVAVVTGDRVLVKDQNDQSENGIYDASTGDWTRSLDFNGNNDIVKGTIVTITNGSQKSSYYSVTTENPITIDSSNIVFSSSLSLSTSGIWTPIVPTATAYTFQEGRYIKIGNAVYIEGHLVINTVSANASAIIGLPFTSNSDANMYGSINFSYFANLVSGIVNLTGYVGGNSTSIATHVLTAAAVTMSASAIIGAGTELRFSGWYMAA